MEKYVVITGASSGIGYDLALQWVDLGFSVICIARRGHLLKELVENAPQKIYAIEFDLADFDNYPMLVERIGAIAQRIEVLINNAGVLINKPFEDFTPLEFDDIIAVNYKAPYFLIQRLIPFIQKSTLKSIINIGSIGGVDNTSKFPGLSIYSSSKGALSTLTECLATEVYSKGCTINCLALSAVKTEMLSNAFPGYIPDVTSRKMAKHISGFVLNNSGIINGKVLQIGGINI